MNTKALVFDAYGTLFDVNSAANKCKEKIASLEHQHEELSGSMLCDIHNLTWSISSF